MPRLRHGERLAGELGEDFRLLEDIGWRPEEERERFELTMSPGELTGTMMRLRDEAAQVLIEHGTEAEAARRDAERDRRFQVGHEACEKALIDLDQRLAG